MGRGNMETLSLPTIKPSGSKIMNGRYQSDALQRQVAGWISFVLQTRHDPPLSKPLTIHLDQLLGTPVDRSSLVAVSFQTFQVLIEQLKVMGIPDTIMPSLYIPLECAEALIAGPFDVETLVQQINYNEPPSLYLTERTLRTHLSAIEQYVFPLRASDFMDNAGEVHVYYNATCSPEDIKNGWEYGRNITAEYYPQAYRTLP